jgi:hypothetical protein
MLTSVVTFELKSECVVLRQLIAFLYGIRTRKYTYQNEKIIIQFVRILKFLHGLNHGKINDQSIPFRI